MNDVLAQRAASLDRNDPLAPLRAFFDLPEGIHYLNGNSLGPPSKATLAAISHTTGHDWAVGLGRSWNDADWINLPGVVGRKISRLLGACERDVIVCDSVSVNIFKLAGALSARRPDRSLACYRNEYPTDSYVLNGLCRLTGAQHIVIDPDTGQWPDDLGILVRSIVDYRTARLADMAAEEERAATAGVDIIWDASHAVGVIDLDFAGNDVRFAVGCGYKFLNGGPGAPAFVYVRGDCADDLHQPVAGWMGHERAFDFADAYRPASGVKRFLAGTPPILAMKALDAALDVFDGVDTGLLEQKARLLGDIFLDRTARLGLKIASAPSARRGAHVSLESDHAYPVLQALAARGVIGDFRGPNLMRFGFSPLFLQYTDVIIAADLLCEVIENREWDAPHFHDRKTVI